MLAAMLKRWRETEKKTVRQMAEIIGVDHTVLWKFEQGQDITRKNWVRIMVWMLTADYPPKTS
jgi:transcriptional regulator with XRE-family HTH domain